MLKQHVARNSVHCIVTSPPYWGLRAYDESNHSKEIGREKTPQEYIERLVKVFRFLRKRLHPLGTCWLNIGASYDCGGRSTFRSSVSSNKGHDDQNDLTRPVSIYGAKQLIPIPWMLGLALQQDGWILRSDVIWHKPNPMPESVRDRCTRSHEYLLMLTKSPHYFYDGYAIAEPTSDDSQFTRKTPARFGGADKYDPSVTRLASGNESPAYATKNKRDVWTLSTQSYKGAHFATFPERLVEPCILAGTSAHGACTACGSPFKRVVNRIRRPTRPGETTKIAGATEANGKLNAMVVGNRDPLRHVTEYKSDGWAPMCQCKRSGVRPCLVLDPFSGSGTCGVVALRHGREYVGIDLYAKYTHLAEGRIRKSLGIPAEDDHNL